MLNIEEKSSKCSVQRNWKERRKVYRNKEVGNSAQQREDSLFIGIIINISNVPIASVCLLLVSAPTYRIMKPVDSFYHSGSNLLRDRESRVSNGGICICPFSSLLSSLITAEVTSPVILSLLYIMHSLFLIYLG